MALAGPVEKISSNEGEGARLLSKRREQQSILLDIRREDAHLSSSYLFCLFPSSFCSSKPRKNSKSYATSVLLSRERNR
jgi:hypothetical protein